MRTHYNLYENILNDSGNEVTRFRLDLTTFNNGKFKFVLPNYGTKTVWDETGVTVSHLLPLDIRYRWNGAPV